MKVFLYEHITATSDSRDPLYAEGAAMRDALRADLDAIPGVRVIDDGFDHCAAIADWTILIAPETGGILQELAERVEQLGGRLLGPSPDAIRLASDKLALAKRWETAGIRTPATTPGGVGERSAFPCVVKPRDGAGSERMALIRDAFEYEAFLRQHPEGMIVQPFLPGTPASLSFLVGANRIVPLQPTLQRLSDDFHYLGGELPLPAGLGERALRLGRAALHPAGPGWRGYVGIDMILGDDRDYAIEINPRLTTSYVGLRSATHSNLAETMLLLAMDLPVAEIAWKPGRVCW